MRLPHTQILFASILLAMTAPASAALLVTEVLPGVSTTLTNGDTVELYNSGPGAIDLTGYILTDLDPALAESSILNEGTFAPLSLSLPLLQPGEFAVIIFNDSTGGTLPSFIETNYGLAILAPLATGASSYLDVAFEQLVLADETGVPLDSVAWGDSGSTTSSDHHEDLAALTLPTAAYGLTIDTASAWGGADAVPDDATYLASAIDFNSLTGVSTWGGGALRRSSTNTTFDEAFPDTAAQWEAVSRDAATLGNFSGPVTTGAGLQPYRVTDDIAAYVASLRISTFPERRVSIAQDQSPSDFKVPSLARQNDFAALIQRCLNGEWEEANADAAVLNYELVEFLDTVTDNTFYILRETTIPGHLDFTGGGVFVFDPSLAAKDLILQAPHPIFDSNTLSQAGMMIQQVRPRVTLIAGAHRKNSTLLTTCDGTFFGGDPYRISDVAHYTETLFHAAHKHLIAALPAAHVIQLHGFCCSVDYGITEDVVVSQGFNSSPAIGTLSRYWNERINGEAFLADDGGGGDLTQSGLYGDGITVLGATNNIQGRLLNGVAEGDECDTAAVSVTGRFIHIEQDFDVREEPQHIINALLNALGDLASRIGEKHWSTIEE